MMTKAISLAIGVVAGSCANLDPAPPPPAEVAYSGSFGCPSGYLNTSPTAHQCCYYQSVTNGFTLYINDSGVATYRSGPGTPCSDSQGNTGCAGTACYHGPNGFSFRYFGGYNNVTVDGADRCAEGGEGGEFSDVTGTFPRGGGCCGDGSGPCDVPDHQSCAACGGGAGEGAWDM